MMQVIHKPHLNNIKIGRHRCLNLILLSCLVLLTPVLSIAQSRSPRPTTARVVTIAGQVEFARAQSTEWRAARIDQILREGDRLRALANSRATILLSDQSVLRVKQLTTIQIQRPQQAGKKAFFFLNRGSIFFYNREKPTDVEFRTPLSSGSIRGTEIAITAEANEEQIAVIDGKVRLQSGDQSIGLQSGDAVNLSGLSQRLTSVGFNASNLIQWTLYYPIVVDVDAIHWTEQERVQLEDVLASYRSGDIAAAVQWLGQSQTNNSPSARLLAAALHVSVGQTREAQNILEGLPTKPREAKALSILIAAINGEQQSTSTNFSSASEWLAYSYEAQSRSQLAEAREAATMATQLSPEFGHAWARLAEMELSFGRIPKAIQYLPKALKLSPNLASAHALQGFIDLERGVPEQAASAFNRSIQLDSENPRGWLGRGITKLSQGLENEGRQDLQIAAALAPNRSELRSYMGKAFMQLDRPELAEKEVRRAKNLDPQNPTPWHYDALFSQQNNRINQAIRSHERSKELNDNQSLFRSKLLLDQDYSLRSATLAPAMLDAGMELVSRREAARALDFDLANPSAHFFLAQSLQRLDDQYNSFLGFETAREQARLTGNLLTPVQGAPLSSIANWQDDADYFKLRPYRLTTQTDLNSNGEQRLALSAYGTFDDLAYALDASYLSLEGFRPNQDLTAKSISLRLKKQLTERDDIYFETEFVRLDAGDTQQYFNPALASATLHTQEDQTPNLVLGLHREWQPGSHTMFVAGRHENDLRVLDNSLNLVFAEIQGGALNSIQTAPFFDLNYRSQFTLYSSELQHRWQGKQHGLTIGLRAQAAELDTHEIIKRALNGLNLDRTFDQSLDRFSAYGYYQWKPSSKMQLTLGGAFERISTPTNPENVPISNNEFDRTRISPKIGFRYDITPQTHFRAAHSRSLGGLFFDNSIRLEPSLIAGFNQAFRSLLSESVVGQLPGNYFETSALGIDHRFKTDTYVGLEFSRNRSDGFREIGALSNTTFLPIPEIPSSWRQQVDYEDRHLVLNINQLIGDHVAIGASYFRQKADLSARFLSSPNAAAAAPLNQSREGTLHRVRLHAVANHSSGLYARVESNYYDQQVERAGVSLNDESLWQHNLAIGYRVPNRKAILELGVLNLFDKSSRLDPLNLMPTLPQERLFTLSLRLNF